MSENPEPSTHDELDDAELAALEPIATRMLDDLDAFLISRHVPIATLGACGHVFDAVPGRYLCDACEPLP